MHDSDERGADLQSHAGLMKIWNNIDSQPKTRQMNCAALCYAFYCHWVVLGSKIWIGFTEATSEQGVQSNLLHNLSSPSLMKNLLDKKYFTIPLEHEQKLSGTDDMEESSIDWVPQPGGPVVTNLASSGNATHRRPTRLYEVEKLIWGERALQGICRLTLKWNWFLVLLI